MARRVSFAVSRTIEVALIVLGIFVIVSENVVGYIAVWDCIGVVYLAIRINRLRYKKVSDDTEWLKRALGPRIGLLFTIFASLVGIVSGLLIVSGGDNADDTLLAKVVGIPAVLLAWGILHFGYAERYAQGYYAALPTQHLVFPNTDRPTFIDFAYFSFTLGATFSVSDVETQTSKIRLQILSHSILSFIYNTATVGIAVSVITG
ncbi:DUF1345 domain-containing protein [Micromonospora vulcania]